MSKDKKSLKSSLRPGIDYYKEIVDCGEIVGTDYNRVTGVRTPTSYCKIHYDRHGKGYMIPFLPQKKDTSVKVDPFTMYMDVLIHIQGALMDEVLPNLRAVSIGFKNNIVTLYCLFYGDCSEKDVDDMSCVETEASCHYFDGEMNFLCVRNCENQPVHPIGDMFAFIRKDTGISLDKNEILHPIVYLRSHPIDPSFPFPSRRLHILLSIQHALLGAVDLNLRLVSIEWTDITIAAYFIFDKEVSESNLQSIKTVQDEMSKDFPRDEIHMQEIHCDYPQRALLPEETMVVYARKETDN